MSDCLVNSNNYNKFILNKNELLKPCDKTKGTLLNTCVDNMRTRKKARTEILKEDMSMNEYLHSEPTINKVTFKEDIEKINVNKYLYNEPTVTHENMDITNESDDDVNQDVTMNDVANETALKICTTKVVPVRFFFMRETRKEVNRAPFNLI